ADQGYRSGSLTALLDYYPRKYAEPAADDRRRPDLYGDADDVVRHACQRGPYEKADYGSDVNWEAEPRVDIESVAAMARSYWPRPLTQACRRTRDEKYARAFVELTSGWIAKHPLENRARIHPVYQHWRGFAWLDIQTGRRATNMCSAFPVMVHA